MRYITVLILLLLSAACQTGKRQLDPYESENLKIEQIAPNTFIHISYLETQNWGKVSCNGMVVLDGGEAIVFDTPTNESASAELIGWIQKTANSRVKAVVATHFHGDCLGGLPQFHQENIPSYAHQKTIQFAKLDSVTLPQNGFEQFVEIGIGNSSVICEFLGEGHTRDNIIAYFPKDKTLFGGCLIKSVGAGKGYLNDANVSEWSKTVEIVRDKFGEATVVVPGHGKVGGQDLLDFTIALFNAD